MVMENSTILIVKGNDLSMKLVRSLLKIANFKIFEAKEAESAIKLAYEHHSDYI